MINNIRGITVLSAACIALLACSTVLQASVVTTNATFEATRQIPLAGPPLTDISVGRSNGGGIYTNQYTGTAGTAGLVHTVASVPINVMRDGVNFTPIGGPSSTLLAPTNLVAFIGLEGTIGPPGSASFGPGRALIYETTGTFDPRDPDTWGYAAGTLLAEFVLSPPQAVIPGVGIGTTIASAVPASKVNVSLGDVLTIGDTDFQFLFEEDSPAGLTTATTGDNWMRDLFNLFAPNPITFEGLFVEGEQDLDQQALGQQISSAPLLTASDLAILNAIAGATALTDLGGVGTGFATAFGAGGGGPTTDYYIDLGLFPAGLATLEGDFYANTAEFNAYPVIAAPIPEPATLFVWAGLGLLASIVASFQRRRISS